MKCLVPSLNAKILGRTIHALARIGDELYIESLPNGLSLRTLNGAESAYAVVTFTQSFFSYFNHGYYTTEDAQGLKCKIGMKSALIVFKSPGHMDKQVDQLEIKLEPESSKLVFQLRCKHGIVKTHYVPILDCKTMQAIYTKETVPNRLSVQHKVLSEAASNFQTSEDQMTFDVCASSFLLKNYVDNDLDLTKIIRTQIVIKPTEFDVYSVNTDTSITFSMKEYRAVLAFAEAVNLPVSIHFETAGNPCVFIIRHSALFEANFVMATMHDEVPSTDVTNVHAENNVPQTSKRKSSTPHNSIKNGKKVHLEDPEISKCLEEDSHLFKFIEIPEESCESATKNDQHNRLQNGNINITNNAVIKNQSICVNRDKLPVDSLLDFDGTLYNTTINHTVTTTSRLKTVFQRCFDISVLESNQVQVLANDSDCD